MNLALILWLAHVLPQPVADPMCLATTIYLEARGEPELGQRAIAEIALRRRDSGAWGDSVCSVVTAPGQFAMVTLDPRMRLNDLGAWISATRAALATQREWDKPLALRHEIVPGASHFAARAHDDPSWNRSRLVAVIGDQNFYRVRGALAARDSRPSR